MAVNRLRTDALKTIKKNQSNSGNRGGRRTGAGRKLGSANKRTREIADQAMASGKSPLELMLSVMRSPKPKQASGEKTVLYLQRVQIWRQQCFDAAKAAAPYCHPRLQAIEHAGPEGDGVPQNITVKFV